MKKFEVIIVRFSWDSNSPRFHRYINAETEEQVKSLVESETLPQIMRERGDQGFSDFYRIDSIKEVSK